MIQTNRCRPTCRFEFNGSCPIVPSLHLQLKALRERRPPWLRQIITPILPTVKMLSLGGERLHPHPTPPQIIIKSFGSLPAPQSGYATLLLCFFFSHLLILEYLNHHQSLISSSLYYPGPRPKISSQSVHNFLSNVIHKQTNQRHQKHNLLCQGGNEGASISRPLVVHLVLGGIFFFSNQAAKF